MDSKIFLYSPTKFSQLLLPQFDHILALVNRCLRSSNEPIQPIGVLRHRVYLSLERPLKRLLGP